MVSLALIKEQKIKEMLEFANAVGAYNCTKPGAIPALPTRAEVKQFIQVNSGSLYNVFCMCDRTGQD